MNAALACLIALAASGDPFADPGLPLAKGEKFRIGRSSLRPATPIAWSPDGKRLAVVYMHATSGVEMPVHVWNVESGDRLFTLRGPHTCVMAVAWSPDGARIATSGMDNVLRFWDAKTGKALAQENLSGHGYSLSYSADGKRLLVGSTRIEMFDAAMKPVALPKLDGMERTPFYHAAALSPDGKTVAAIRDGVRVWDAETGKLLRTIARDGDYDAGGVTFTEDGKALVVNPGHKDAAQIDLTTGKRTSVGAVPGTLSGTVRVALLSPDGKRVAVGRPDGALQVYDTASGKLNKTLREPWPSIFRVAYAAGGKVLRVVHTEGTINDFNADTGKHLAARRLALDKNETLAAVERGGELLLTRGPETVRVRRLDTGKDAATLRMKWAKTAAFSADGEFVAAATAGLGGWDWEAVVATVDGKVVGKVRGEQGSLESVATDGSSLYTGLHCQMNLPPGAKAGLAVQARRYDLKSGKAVKEWKAVKAEDTADVVTDGVAVEAVLVAPKGEAVVFVESVALNRIARRGGGPFKEHWLRVCDPSEPEKERRKRIAGWEPSPTGPWSEEWRQQFGHYALTEATALSPKGRSLALLSHGYSEKAEKLLYRDEHHPVWRNVIAGPTATGRWTLTDGSVEVRPGGAELAVSDRYGSVVVVRTADLKEGR